jgi:hypothetical protein
MQITYDQMKQTKITVHNNAYNLVRPDWHNLWETGFS